MKCPDRCVTCRRSSLRLSTISAQHRTVSVNWLRRILCVRILMPIRCRHMVSALRPIFW